MRMRRNPFFVLTASVLAVFLLCGFGIPFRKRKKYETPISKETLQPDKILFDAAIKDIEKGAYETARVTLNTLINTYDTSEYLAKAKLAIADMQDVMKYAAAGAHARVVRRRPQRRVQLAGAAAGGRLRPARLPRRHRRRCGAAGRVRERRREAKRICSGALCAPLQQWSMMPLAWTASSMVS